MKTIFFDMDGTLCDLYGVENWLDYLRAGNAFPYENAKPLVSLSLLARYLHRCQLRGYNVEIISWLAKDSTTEYDELVTVAKLCWLKTHLPSVSFRRINIVPYGTCKDSFRHSEMDILFDDEKQNREAWGGLARDVNSIIEDLKWLS